MTLILLKIHTTVIWAMKEKVKNGINEYERADYYKIEFSVSMKQKSFEVINILRKVKYDHYLLSFFLHPPCNMCIVCFYYINLISAQLVFPHLGINKGAQL